jgi:hypothetical protein
MQSFECVLQQHPAAALQPLEHTARFAVAIAGLHAKEVGGIGVAFDGVAAEVKGLQVGDGVGAALVLVRAAALAAAPGA